MLSESAWRIVNVDIEGGARVVRDPADPGGTTKWGFAQRYHPDVDVAELTELAARARAEDFYWRPACCERLRPSLALLVYDAAFQHGVSAATLMFQRALRVTPDGVIGVKTLHAARTAGVREVILRMQEERARKYLGRNDRAEERFEVGWVNRLVRITLECTLIWSRGDGNGSL